MIKKKKTFDSVLMMRSIRDELSRKMKGMTFDEELAWLTKTEIKDPFLKRLREKIAQPADQLDGTK